MTLPRKLVGIGLAASLIGCSPPPSVQTTLDRVSCGTKDGNVKLTDGSVWDKAKPFPDSGIVTVRYTPRNSGDRENAGYLEIELPPSGGTYKPTYGYTIRECKE